MTVQQAALLASILILYWLLRTFVVRSIRRSTFRRDLENFSEAMTEQEIIDWLRTKPTTSRLLGLADSIERGDHRKDAE